MNEIFCNKYYEEILRYFVLYKNPTISNTEHTNSLKVSVWSTICKRNIVSAKIRFSGTVCLCVGKWARQMLAGSLSLSDPRGGNKKSEVLVVPSSG